MKVWIPLKVLLLWSSWFLCGVRCHLETTITRHQQPSSICHYESSWFTLVTLRSFQPMSLLFFWLDFLGIFRNPKTATVSITRKDKCLQEHCEGQGPLFARKNSCCTKSVYQLHNFRGNRSTASQTHLFSAATKDIWFQMFLCENHPGKEMPQQPFPQKTLPKLHPLLSGSYRTSASGTLVPSPKIRARAWDWSIKNTGKFSREKKQYACLNSWKSPRKKYTQQKQSRKAMRQSKKQVSQF